MSVFGQVLISGTKPGNGWVKWHHSGIPDEEGKKRDIARKGAALTNHCETCTALSGCYFPSFNMPLYPQHPNCDCLLFAIVKPISQSKASCAIEKFTDYLFSERYADNGKIKLFRELGFTIEDSDNLKWEFERQALCKYLEGDYILGKLNEYGQRITIEIGLNSPKKGDIIIKTGWMIRPLGFLTCNTPLGAK